MFTALFLQVLRMVTGLLLLLRTVQRTQLINEEDNEEIQSAVQELRDALDHFQPEPQAPAPQTGSHILHGPACTSSTSQLSCVIGVTARPGPETSDTIPETPAGTSQQTGASAQLGTVTAATLPADHDNSRPYHRSAQGGRLRGLDVLIQTTCFICTGAGEREREESGDGDGDGDDAASDEEPAEAPQ